MRYLWFALACLTSTSLNILVWIAVRDLGIMEASLAQSVQQSTDRIPQIVATAEKDVIAITDKQATGLRSQMRETAAAVLQVSIDTRADTLQRVDAAVEAVNGIRNTVDSALNGRNGIVPSIAVLTASSAALADRYRTLPDDIAEDRVFKAYMAQGLGTLAATKVFMGETAKAGRTFDAQFPVLMANVTESAGHFNHVADHFDRALTGPTTVRAKIVEWGKLAVTGANAYTHVK